MIVSDSGVKKQSVRHALLCHVTSVIRRILVNIWREHQIGAGVEYPEAVWSVEVGIEAIPRGNH